MLLLMFLLGMFGEAVSLQCYSCSNLVNSTDCTSTVTCTNDQVCYKKREFKSQIFVDFGCVDKQSCGRYAKISNYARTMKVDGSQTQYCYECCSSDNCNKYLCEYSNLATCVDDKTIDCARWNSMFSICEVINKAKLICPNYCNLCHVVDGNWSPWSSWSTCDVTCENGTESRVRYCDNPPPQYGGLGCSGDGIELKTCKRRLCPVHGGWSDWAPWGKCPETCGIGMMSRTRSCTNPIPDRFGNHCFGNSLENALCNSGPCGVNGGLSDWEQWGKCSVTCGIGMQSRARSCSNPSPNGNGNTCFGRDLDVKLCYPGLCSNKWSEWQSWSSCSEDCGVGVHTRSRWCFNPTTFKSEGDCSGSSYESEPCENKVCATDCYDVLNKQNATKSGVYNVTLWRSKQRKQVHCDMETDNGGWTVFQYRFNGSVDFYRNSTEYERGFGDFVTEYWLGLFIVQEMTTQSKSELRIELTAADGTTAFETFQNFFLGPSPHYRLNIDRGTGTAGDSLTYHNGYRFTTYDIDIDGHPTLNCAAHCHGAWWYNRCFTSNLNGKYVTPGSNDQTSMTYRQFKQFYSLKTSKMMFRRV